MQNYYDGSNAWKKKLKWDITHEEALLRVADETFCFDPDLSYETTGYRPITPTRGLDFDPTPFREAGEKQVKSGRYTDFYYGSRNYRDWWLEQFRRCNEGYVVNNYRITGDNYFFLNYYSMLIADGDKKAGAGRVFTHPGFWAMHYEWFHYIELAEELGYDCAGLKSRGVGFSEIGASLGVRPYTTVPNFHTVYVANYEPFLTGKGILSKCWAQLHWLNENTEGAMRRLRQNIDQAMHKKASKMDAQRQESGHKSQISGQVVDKADKLRGDRAERVIFEESGSNPVLSDTYTVSEALVAINGDRHGTRIIFGTGGDSDVATGDGKKITLSGLHGLEKMFLDPRTYGILPYKHKYNNRGLVVETGYFVPAWRTIKSAMDHRGVVDEAQARGYYEKIRTRLRKDAQAYLKHCAEYCFTYEEALSRKGSNRFNQGYLADQRVEVEINQSTPKPKRGHLLWTYTHDTNRVNGVKFVEKEDGNIEVLEFPDIDPSTNLPIKNLYVGGIDSIDVGADESIVADKGSQFCILIKKRSDGLKGNQYICKYLDRPGKAREAYDIAMKILYWYGCQANIEATRVGLIGYFRDKNMSHLLMKRPKYALEGQSNNKLSTNLIGTQASPKMIEYGIDLIRDFVEDYCQGILFLDMIIQLQEYSDEFKGKYDIIAAMQMCEIGDQELMGVLPKREVKEEWADVGYYKDERGIRRWGVIPNNKPTVDVEGLL